MNRFALFVSVAIPCFALGADAPSKVVVDAQRGATTVDGKPVKTSDVLKEGAALVVPDGAWVSLFLTPVCARAVLKGPASFTIGKGSVAESGGKTVATKPLSVCKDHVDPELARFAGAGAVAVRANEDAPIAGLPGTVVAERPALAVIAKGADEATIRVIDDSTGKSLWEKIVVPPAFAEPPADAPALEAGKTYRVEDSDGRRTTTTWMRAASADERVKIASLRAELEGEGDARAPSILFSSSLEARGLVVDRLLSCRESPPAPKADDGFDKVCRPKTEPLGLLRVARPK